MDDVASLLEEVQTAVGRALRSDETWLAGRMLREGKTPDEVAEFIGPEPPKDVPDEDLNVDAAIMVGTGAFGVPVFQKIEPPVDDADS